MERMSSVDYKEKAAGLHARGCNCCQAVIMCAAEQFGLTEEQAYGLGAFFGGGMRCGEVCGAVSGALMGLGLKYGDADNRQCGKSKEFLKAFKAAHGSILCRELLERNQKKMCPTFINFAANYLEDELK